MTETPSSPEPIGLAAAEQWARDWAARDPRIAVLVAEYDRVAAAATRCACNTTEQTTHDRGDEAFCTLGSDAAAN